MQAGPLARAVRGGVVVALAVAALLTVHAPESGPVERALAALHAAGADDATTLEAVVAAGLDPTDWHGRDVLHAVAVPAPGQDPVDPLREAYAVLSAGVDPRAWDDRVRGRVDLMAELEHNAPAALASSNDAAQSFQLLAMAAAQRALERLADGAPATAHATWNDTVAALRERLLELQTQRGAWGCGPWHGPECTGFALAALHATGGVPADAAERAAGSIMSRFHGAAFSDPAGGADVQVTVWAVQGLRLAGADVPPAAQGWVLSQQGADGMWRVGERPSPWATAEVIVMLSGGHPIA